MGIVAKDSSAVLLAACAPRLMAGATILNYGATCVVIDHHDGSVSKIFCGADDILPSELMREPRAEATILRLLNEQAGSQKGALVPILLHEPEYMATRDFYAHYRMTKMPGQTMAALLYNSFDGAHDDYFDWAGKALADFHRVAAAIPAPDFPAGHRQKAPEIVACAELDDDTNRALSAANAFLREARIQGTAHGDIHLGNIIIDRSTGVAGLIDVATCRRTDNIACDLLRLYDEFADSRSMDRLLDSYNQHAAQPIGKPLLRATRLAQMTGAAFGPVDAIGRPGLDREQIDADLRYLKPVIGLYL